MPPKSLGIDRTERSTEEREGSPAPPTAPWSWIPEISADKLQKPHRRSPTALPAGRHDAFTRESGWHEPYSSLTYWWLQQDRQRPDRQQRRCPGVPTWTGVGTDPQLVMELPAAQRPKRIAIAIAAFSNHKFKIATLIAGSAEKSQELLWERFQGLPEFFRNFFRKVSAVLGAWPNFGIHYLMVTLKSLQNLTCNHVWSSSNKEERRYPPHRASGSSPSAPSVITTRENLGQT